MQEISEKTDPFSELVHATCVAWNGRAMLIIGPSGSGKSALALALMARGADLVSDDRVMLTRRQGRIVASAPSSLDGLIEARGVGILKCVSADPTPLEFVVDLSNTEEMRLPERHSTQILGLEFTVLFRVDAPHFTDAVLQMLKSGRWAPQ